MSFGEILFPKYILKLFKFCILVAISAEVYSYNLGPKLEVVLYVFIRAHNFLKVFRNLSMIKIKYFYASLPEITCLETVSILTLFT